MKASEWALLPSVVAIAATLVLFHSGLPLPPLLPYLWHKLLHIVGAVIVLGNITVTGLWMMAAMIGDRPQREFGARVVSWADAAFSGPGTLLLLFNGEAMASQIGGVSAHPFLRVGIVLFLVGAAVWLLTLVPVQHVLLKSPGDSLLFKRAFWAWIAFGTPAALLPWVGLGIMVLRV